MLGMGLWAVTATGQDAAKPAAAKPSPATQDAAKPGAAAHAPAPQEPAKPDAAKPDAPKPDDAKANPSAPDAGAQDAAKQEAGAFHWVDFHNEADQPVIVWVTRALTAEKWTAIREIGVMYDAALVVTTERASPDSLPSSDTFQLWSVNLTNHVKTPLLKGVNLRWLDWINLREGSPRELAALYDDCRNCAATTYFTAFHYDFNQHILVPRWLRGGQAAPVWTGTAPAGVMLGQIFAVLADPDGRQYLATWSHYDYGRQKPAEDYVFRYDVDAFNGMERSLLVTHKDGEAMEQRLCQAQGANPGMASGQDSGPCTQTVHARTERKPVTRPPANNQGRSTPPGVRR